MTATEYRRGLVEQYVARQITAAEAVERWPFGDERGWLPETIQELRTETGFAERSLRVLVEGLK